MDILVVATALLALFCLVRPFSGLHVVVVAGFLQDPLRKLLPGNAFYMVLLAFFLFTFCAAGLFARGGLRRLQRSATFGLFRVPVAALFLLVLVQTLHSYARWGSAVISGIGFLSYLGPVAAASAGYLLSLRTSRLLALFRAYALLGTLAAGSVLAARLWPEMTVLRPIGEGLMVYGENLRVELASGLLRTPEVAAWHAATTACVLLILLTVGDRGRRRLGELAYGAFGLAVAVLAILFTGRRKALAELVFFAAVYFFLLFRARQRPRRLVTVVVLGGAIVGYQLLSGAFAASESRATAHLVSRGGSVAEDSTRRLTESVGSAAEALRRYGLFGVGAGSSAQGTQYFGADASIGLVAEPGIGRIAAELGILGLLLAGWLVVRLGGELRRRVASLAIREPGVARLGFGLLSLLLANALVFVTASQIFGDPFVYLLLGLIAGGIVGLIDGTAPAGRRATDRGNRPELAPATGRVPVLAG
ncbi:hypothetical protein FBQ97_04775 [Acidobacteria bacterium ACD]|nr:MAG: hypothetical protein EDX89_15110 [Acidobacteriota bacterium]MCE7956334.1 hypothetical protein [Acidobacteria bacterium ACB2]MDL1949114.1 hypothetical protein [Acidobacteria bacterium ACD]